MNEYIGVFWWNQRQRLGAFIPSASVQFGGTFVAGDQIFVDMGGQIAGKFVIGTESPALIASHFALLINATYVGVYAAVEGDLLTITSRSPTAAYNFPLNVTTELELGSTGTAVQSGQLLGGAPGRWEIDPAQTPALNRGARDWHADMYAQSEARGREFTTACSMELVEPPIAFAARFPDGPAVETSIGFGTLKSTHCAFSTPMLNYQKAVYGNLVSLMATAGLTPNVQFGEFVWWFFTNWEASNADGGMAFFDAETAAAAQTALGRPLFRFLRPNDSPNVNASADAIFLRNRLRNYVSSLAAHVRAIQPATQVELLFPYDVNHPSPAGIHQLGGALNRFVNFAAEWEAKSTSGLDRLKMEALDFGAWSRSLDLARTAIEFPLVLGWPKESVRYLVPVFRPASAWEKEYLLAKDARIPVINFWAFDHFCLYGIDPREPAHKGTTSIA